MFTVQCTIHNVHCKVNNSLCNSIPQCIQSKVYRLLFTVHYTQSLYNMTVHLTILTLNPPLHQWNILSPY